MSRGEGEYLQSTETLAGVGGGVGGLEGVMAKQTENDRTGGRRQIEQGVLKGQVNDDRVGGGMKE